jgi:hypothetical protein
MVQPARIAAAAAIAATGPAFLIAADMVGSPF